MVVEWARTRSFDGARRVAGPRATAETDHTAKVLLEGLPPGSRIHYRVRFEGERPSEWLEGSLSTAPEHARDVVFAWSGDTNGQGFGIDPARGGMPTYRTLLERAPDFFVHCGDAIYADNPILPTIELPDGSVWRNVVTEAKSHVAETLADYRGAHLYPRLSAEVRALSLAVPTLSLWDDHEVHDDWFPGQTLDDERYTERRVDVLAGYARRAMLEYAPSFAGAGGAKLYRAMRYGPRLELFFVDGRSHRTANHPAPPEARFFGPEQIAWLAESLSRSTATWKVVACDMPLGLVLGRAVPGTEAIAYDAIANGDGPPAGRELELAGLLRTLQARSVKNLVFLTADVHYAAAHRYAPERAACKEFDPFWEFVAGPMHAKSFPRKPLDDTFGPEVVWASDNGIGSPATGEQYFGMVRIEGKSGAMTVMLVDGRGRTLHTTVLQPAA
jgi:alkaline phosphatase D